MSPTLALVGGDEFRPGCEEADRAIIEATGKERPVTLVIPTAAARQAPERAADNGTRWFSTLGADARSLMILDRADATNSSISQRTVMDADIVYFTGGDPLHLLRTLRESRLMNIVNAAYLAGTVIAGSSAGAMVLGSYMRFRGEWHEALGMARGIAVLPHHENADPAAVSEELSDSTPDDIDAVFGIGARCAAVRTSNDPDEWKIFGPDRVIVYRKHSWLALESGRQFQL